MRLNERDAPKVNPGSYIQQESGVLIKWVDDLDGEAAPHHAFLTEPLSLRAPVQAAVLVTNDFSQITAHSKGHSRLHQRHTHSPRDAAGPRFEKRTWQIKKTPHLCRLGKNFIL